MFGFGDCSYVFLGGLYMVVATKDNAIADVLHVALECFVCVPPDGHGSEEGPLIRLLVILCIGPRMSL